MKKLLKFALPAIIVGVLVGGFYASARIRNPIAGDSTSLSAAGAVLKANNGTDFASTTMTFDVLAQTGYLSIGSTTADCAFQMCFSKTTTNPSPGIAIYNTNDQTTNYERVALGWSSSVAQLLSSKGGTGTQRNLEVGVDIVKMAFSNSGTTKYSLNMQNTLATAGAIIFDVSAPGSTGFTGSSGSQTSLRIAPTLTQTGTAGWVGLLLNPTESSVGSGSRRLISGQVGSTDRFVVSDNGDTSITGSSSSTLVIGGTSSNPGCIEMGDSDNSGISYITVANGTLSATSTKPSFCL